MRVFLVIAIVGALCAAALDVDNLVAIKAEQGLEKDDGMIDAELIETEVLDDWKDADSAVPGYQKMSWNSGKGVEFEEFDPGEPKDIPSDDELAEIMASVAKFKDQVVAIEDVGGGKTLAMSYKISDSSIAWIHKQDPCKGEDCVVPPPSFKLTALGAEKLEEWDQSGPPQIASAAVEVDATTGDEMLSLSQDTSKLDHTKVHHPGGFAYAKVANTQLDPFLRVGRLAMGCTGSLIGERLVVTSAHCLFDHTSKKFQPLPKCKFTPGKTGATEPHGTFDAKAFIVSRKFVEATRYSEVSDWAIIVLENSPGLGYFGFGVQALDATQLTLAGYPQSKNTEMWVSVCPTTATKEAASLHHMCDTEPGNSGSSMILKKADGWYVRAIHSGGNAVTNWACKINTEVYEHLAFYRELYPN